MLALCDGVVEAVSATGTREVGWQEFFAGPLETNLRPEELAVAVRFARMPAGTRTDFQESARRHGDYALAGVAVAVTVVGGVVTHARASFVSVTDVPSVLDLGGALRGVEPGSGAWAEAVDTAAAAVRDHVQPESDIHATSDYRRMLVGELTRRALHESTPAAEGDR